MNLKDGRKKLILSALFIICINFLYSQKRSIPDLISLISNHQFPNNPLVEGTYVKGSWEDVKNTTMPETMYWSYPIGVIQLGMQRGYEITHDKNILKYISDNNRISADEFLQPLEK